LKLGLLRGDFGAVICSLLTRQLQRFANGQNSKRVKSIPFWSSSITVLVIVVSRDYRLTLAPKEGANTSICFLLTNIRNAEGDQQRYVTH